MTDERRCRTWAEIDLDALEHNYRALRALAPQGCRFLGLVKADAYGHGAVPVARKLQALGADMLAVACLAEGRELRQAGIALPILCLGQTPEEQAPSCWSLTSLRRWRTWRRGGRCPPPPWRRKGRCPSTSSWTRG